MCYRMVSELMLLQTFILRVICMFSRSMSQSAFGSDDAFHVANFHYMRDLNTFESICVHACASPATEQSRVLLI